MSEVMSEREIIKLRIRIKAMSASYVISQYKSILQYEALMDKSSLSKFFLSRSNHIELVVPGPHCSN